MTLADWIASGAAVVASVAAFISWRQAVHARSQADSAKSQADSAKEQVRLSAEQVEAARESNRLMAQQIAEEKKAREDATKPVVNFVCVDGEHNTSDKKMFRIENNGPVRLKFEEMRLQLPNGKLAAVTDQSVGSGIIDPGDFLNVPLNTGHAHGLIQQGNWKHASKLFARLSNTDYEVPEGVVRAWLQGEELVPLG